MGHRIWHDETMVVRFRCGWEVSLGNVCGMPATYWDHMSDEFPLCRDHAFFVLKKRERYSNMAAVSIKGAADYKQTEVKTMAEFEERTGGTFWKAQNEGDSIEGTLLKVREGQYGPVYDIDTKEGMQTIPSSAVLANRLSASDEGKYIKVVFDGLQQSKIKGRNGEPRNPTKLYKVFFRK